MPRRIIGEEVAAKALSLHRQGLSYRRIGAALGIDPRTAKEKVQMLAVGEQLDHWKSVERQVDVRYMEEHYHLMLCTGAGVLRAVETHPLNSASNVGAEVWLKYQVGSALTQAQDLLVGRGMLMTSGLEAEVEIPEKVSQGLLAGLKQHEESLVAALDGQDGWVKRWTGFQKAREKLTKEARSLLSQRGCHRDRASRIAEAAVQALIQEWKAESLSSSGLGAPTLPAEDGDNYRWILEQIRNPGRLPPLKLAETGVTESASKVEKEILQMQLRGRPDGHCSLCPSRGGT